jgi:hypothetical protein
MDDDDELAELRRARAAATGLTSVVRGPLPLLLSLLRTPPLADAQPTPLLPLPGGST